MKYVSLASGPSFQATNIFPLMSHAQWVDIQLNQIRGQYFKVIRTGDSMPITRKVTIVSRMTPCSLPKLYRDSLEETFDFISSQEGLYCGNSAKTYAVTFTCISEKLGWLSSKMM